MAEIFLQCEYCENEEEFEALLGRHILYTRDTETDRVKEIKWICSVCNAEHIVFEDIFID